MSDQTRSEQGWLPDASRGRHARRRLSLSLAWSLSEPGRVGESVELPVGQPSVLGRGGDDGGDEAVRLGFRPVRPGTRSAGSPLASPGVSRVQLRFSSPGPDGVEVESVGKAALIVDGRRVSRATIGVGSRVHVERQLLMLVVATPDDVTSRGTAPPFPFGQADPFGIVGESARAYALRDEIAFLARRSGHVFIQGPSGAGKELCARAVHAVSTRAKGPFVSRNAATLPTGIIDAELFGNAKNYPNAGMRERKGIVGEADGGTLFLDEIAELPHDLQAHLLRLLDGGEYHRLGEEHAREADVRMIGATNRDVASLKHDLLARFTVRLAVPGLDERREDIPLLAASILRRHADGDEELRHRFFEGGHARIDPELMDALLARSYTTHVRELETLLVASMAASRGTFLALPDALRPGAEAATAPTAAVPARPPPSREEVEAGLAAASGNVSRAWQAMGLSSRDALRRLMKKYGLEPSG